MRSAKIIKMGIAALVVGVAMLATTTAQAQNNCVANCIDQYDRDRQACDQALSTALAGLDAEAAQCAVTYPNNPLQYGLCIQRVNTKRYSARRDWQRCINLANTAAYNCYRKCQVSDSQPGR